MDLDFPGLLGAELFRPDGAYIAKFVIQPQVVHDFSAVSGASVQLDRYNYWPGSGLTEADRRRVSNQTIGTSGAREVTKTKVPVFLEEFTGPNAGDPLNPSAPGNLMIPVQDIIRAQRFLYDLGNPAAFHQSIGSLTLIQDFRRWQDRVYINRLLDAAALGPASKTQGGYYNPDRVVDGGTYANGPERFSTNDLVEVITDMRERFVPPFSSPMGPVYHSLCSPTFVKHLRRDPDFKEVARYPGAIGINMLQPGAMPMSAPMMPAPGDWRGMPNTLVQSGGFYGQVGYMYGDMMPTGFVWEGARIFECTNLPTANVTLTYTAAVAGSGAATGSATRTGFLGAFFGMQAVGEGVFGNGPEVRINENSDYQRFINAIWHLDAGFATLNENFITIARTYEN